MHKLTTSIAVCASMALAATITPARGADKPTGRCPDGRTFWFDAKRLTFRWSGSKSVEKLEDEHGAHGSYGNEHVSIAFSHDFDASGNRYEVADIMERKGASWGKDQRCRVVD